MRPSSGWKYSVRGKLSVWSKCRCAWGGDDDEISFTNMGLVAGTVLAQVCVRLVSSLLVGWPAGMTLLEFYPMKMAILQF